VSDYVVSRPLTSGGNWGQDWGQVTEFTEGCPQIPLTATAVKNAKPQSKPKRLFDGGGLYLEVAPSGGKWWRFKYRFAGKEKRISLGVYPDVSLKDARDRRDEARRLLANDIDPSKHRQSHKVHRGRVQRTHLKV
jgi:hypothetical protein